LLLVGDLVVEMVVELLHLEVVAQAGLGLELD
jgi:hypothetical protein